MSEPRLLCGVSDGRKPCGRPVTDVRFLDPSFLEFVEADCPKHGPVSASAVTYRNAKKVLHLQRVPGRLSDAELRDLLARRRTP